MLISGGHILNRSMHDLDITKGSWIIIIIDIKSDVTVAYTGHLQDGVMWGSLMTPSRRRPVFATVVSLMNAFWIIILPFCKLFHLNLKTSSGDRNLLKNMCQMTAKVKIEKLSWLRLKLPHGTCCTSAILNVFILNCRLRYFQSWPEQTQLKLWKFTVRKFQF